MERLVSYFNSKMPSLYGGYLENVNGNVYYNIINPKTKINTTLEDILKIKKPPIDKLYDIYKKLNDELIWIKKYVFGYGSQHPYVDYVFDHCYESLKQINKPREYYYVNFEESELKYKISSSQQITFNSSCQSPVMRWHFAQEKIIKSIGQTLTSIIGDSTIAKYNYVYTGQQVNCHILSSFPETIISKRKQWGYSPNDVIYSSFFEKEDYNELINLAKIAIEIIEFTRPEIICDNIVELVKVEKKKFQQIYTVL